MKNFPAYRPRVQNPYPDHWNKISDFEFIDHLYMARAKKVIASPAGREAEYLVYAEYRYACTIDGERREFTVPSGMLTDLTSVPRFARWIVGRVGPHLEAAIVHDFLFVAWQDLPGGTAKEKDFRFANEVMLQAMIAANVSWLRRTLIHAAVTSYFGRKIFFSTNPDVRYVRIPPPESSTETAATDKSPTDEAREFA